MQNIVKTDNFLDPSLIRQLSISRPEYLVHCAWDKDHVTNFKKTLHAIELAKAIKCKGIITFGSFEEYGILKKNISEDLTCNPKSDFGNIKHAIYLTCKSICKSLDIKYCHVRLSIPYSMRDHEDFYFTKIIKSISKGNIPENLGNIYASKDYIHASDISRAIISLAENNAEGIFNLASGESTSTKTLLNMIFQKFGKEHNIKEKVNPSQGYQDFSLSTKKIYDKISWKPSISIWDGLSLLVHENKFTSKPSLEEFADRMRKLCR